MWQLLIIATMLCLNLSSCFERVVEPEDVFGAVRRGGTYSQTSKMIDSWLAVAVLGGMVLPHLRGIQLLYVAARS